MAREALLRAHLGPEIDDPDEETFLLFSQDIPSQNLGFVDAHAAVLDLAVAGKDYVIHQSPAVLSSNRAGGTTGAVLWKVTPLFADWIASPENLLWKSGALTPASAAVELGCGISGLIGMALGQSVARYVLTDQPYVSKWVETNLAENMITSSTGPVSRRKGKKASPAQSRSGHVAFAPLDWELDEVTPALTGSEETKSFDAVIACDCIYNEALIPPLVQTCVDVCKLRASEVQSPALPATLCIVAQQLRDPEIFESWIKAFHERFQTWRVPESCLSDALRANAGFVIHVGLLREGQAVP